MVIQFFTPLTLIVGTNGSGKTTIIECLKYASTGELPPNSKGGAFIHDPKLCGEKEVMAQVRMSFNNTSKARMVVTRNIQLTVKKTTRSQKTLEGNIVLINHGERLSLSTRVAEMDRSIPMYLGVSKAILESVVFCHQDDSLWPMSEPASLKKRFDEIFEALKYTKAIDNIKQLRKKKNEEYKQFQIKEEHAKQDKAKADKADQKRKGLGEAIEDLKHEAAAFQEEARETGRKSQEAWNNVARYTEVVESLKAARKNQSYYERDVLDLRKDLKELPDTDDELTRQLNKHQERMDQHTEREEEQKTHYRNIERDINQTRSKLGEKHLEVGKHEQQKATHEQKVKDRESEIKRSAHEHNIRGFDTELDDMQINDFLERIKKLRNEQNSKVERLRKDNAAEVQKAQVVLDKLRERRSALQESKRSARGQITSNESRLNALHKDFGKISMDEAGKASLEASIEDLEGRLQKTRDQATTADTASKLKHANDQLQRLEDDSDSLKAELLQATKQSGELARLDHLKKETKNRQRSLDTMKGAHGTRLEELLGRSWDPKSLESDFQSVLENKNKKVADAETRRDEVNRSLQQVDFKLKSYRDELKRKQKEVDDCVKTIHDKIESEPGDYREVLAECEVNRDTRKSDVEGFRNMAKYFNDCIKVAQSKDPACRLCSRPFEDTKLVRQFIKKLQDQIAPSRLRGLQDELDIYETDLQSARDASPSYDNWMRLTEKELPALKKEIAKQEEQREAFISQVEDHDSIVTGLQDSRRDAEALSKPVSTTTQYWNELRNLEVEIKDLAAKQNSASQGRGLDDIQDMIETVSAEAKEQRKTISKLQGESERSKEQISSLSLDLGNVRSKLMTAQHELEKSASISKQIDDLKSTNKDQREFMQSLDSQLQELGPQFLEEEAKLQDVRERADAKERQLQSAANDLNDTVRRLQHTDQEVRDYVEQGGPAKLERCQRDIETLRKDISALETDRTQVTVEINKIQKELAHQDEHKRVINDNLKYRRRKRELEETNAEVDRLSAQNAEADQQRYSHDAERFQKAHQKATMEKTSKLTELKVKDDQLQQLERDWETDYKDAKMNYKRAHIEVETTKAAVDDLGKYGGALDKAIMKYHGMKMEEINRSIDELWRSTYQGTDVDTILIRSDNETAKGNRSYNYRVCMVKQDVEMDMRGRCSAGQKVLASIIIRLALADSFGVSCGLIALDEPTTNLDRDNIRALAESLHELIKERQQQSNFQLIVITHDEDFLRYMKCSDFSDYYWRISRNPQQKSVIDKQSIAEVM